MGSAGALVKNLRSYQQTQLIAQTSTSTGLVRQLNSEADIQSIIGSSYLGNLSSPESIASTAQQVAEAIANRKVYEDRPIINQTYEQQNILGSLLYIINQMQQQGATILAMTIGATPGTFGSNGSIGNGIVVCSTKRPFDGRVLENSFAETIQLTCVQDSYTGGATQGNEGFALTGAGAQTDFFAFNWPLGSNANTSLNAIDGSQDNTSGNILTNSGFSSWSAGLPTGYVFNGGNSQVFKEVGNTYDGNACLRILGDGTTNLNFEQQFNSSAGTVGTLSPQTQYAFNIFAARDGTIPGAGVLTVDLCDGNGVTILDQANIANSTTITLTSLGTSFAPFNISFRTPVVMPSSYFVRYRMTTGLTGGRSVYLARGALGEMTSSYVAGPYFAVFSGSVPFQSTLPDFQLTVISNSRGAGGTLSSFQPLMSQFFPSAAFANGLLYPSSATPSISDVLIS